MADHIGEALVTILPDFSRFREEYGIELATATRRDTVTIKALLDTKELRAEYALAQAQIKDFFARTRTYSEQYQRDVTVAHERALKEQARRDNSAFKEQAQASARAQRERLTLARTEDEKFTQAIARAHTAALAEEDRRNANQEKKERERRGRGLGFLGSAGAANLVQGPAIAALLAAITPVTAGVLGLASAFAVAGGAAGGFAVAATGHIAQLTTVMKQVKDEGQQLSDLPAPFQKMIPALQAFTKDWQLFLQNTRAPVFDVFEKGLTIAETGLHQLTPIVNIAAGAFSKALDSVSAFASGPQVARFLAVVAQQAPAAIQSLTNSAINLGTGLVDMLTGFAPVGTSMLSIIEKITQKFRDWAGSLQGSKTFQDFLTYAQAQGPHVIEIISNLAVTLGKLIVGLAPIGQAVVGVLNGFLALTSAISPGWWSAIIIGATGLLAVFKGFPLVVVAATNIMKAWAATTTLASTVITMFKLGIGEFAAVWTGLPSLFAAARAGLIGFFATLTAGEIATGVGVILVLVGAIVALVSSLHSDSAAQDAAAAATLRHKDAVESFAEALRQSNGVVTSSILDAKINQLNDKLVTVDRSANNTFKNLWGWFDTAPPGAAPSGKLLELAQKAGVNLKQLSQGAAGDAGSFKAATKSWQDYINTLQADYDKKYKYTSTTPEAKAAREIIDLNKNALGSYKELSVSKEEAVRVNKLLEAAGLAPAFNAEGQALQSVTPLMDAYNKSISPTDQENLANAVVTTTNNLTAATRTAKEATIAEAKTRSDSAYANVQADRSVRDSREHLADVIKSTTQDNLNADQKIIDSQKSMRDAHAATKKAVIDLAQARKDAAKALRDQADAEESTSIALAQARLEVRRTSTRDPRDLVRRQALLGLDQALHADQDTRAQGVQIRRQGVEGAPAVVAARQTLADDLIAQSKADKDLVKAHQDRTTTFVNNSRARRDAQEQVNDAVRNQAQTLTAGKKADQDAHQRTLDSASALGVAKAAMDKSNTGLIDMGVNMGLTKKASEELNAQMQKAMSLDSGNVPKQLQDIGTAITALKLMAGDLNMNPATAFKTAQGLIAAGAISTSGTYVAHQPGDTHPYGTFGPIAVKHGALGGGIWGGVPGVDSVPALLMPGEHIWTSDEVQKAGGHGAVEKMRASVRGYAGGGRVDISHLNFARSLEHAGILDKVAAARGFAPKGGIAAGGSLGSTAIAAAAYAAGKSIGANDREMLAMFEAGIVESGFKNYANSTVPESLSLPHDAVGSDHDSVGFLQQRAGWGSVAQRMNASYAATKFLQKAMRLDRSTPGSAGDLAQAVQVSAFPDRYNSAMSEALGMIKRAVSSSIGKVPGAQHYTVADVMEGLLVSPGASGGGGTVGGAYAGFPAWPKNDPPNLPHVDSGVWRQIVGLVKSSGIPSDGGAGGNYQPYNPPNQIHWHTTGRAVDFMGANQNKLGDFFLARQPNLLELIHRTKSRDYGVSRGVTWDYNANSGVLNQHKNHLHVAMDTGGILPPHSRTIVDNNTSHPETVRTAEQEAALGMGRELSPTTIARLAAAIARALANHPMQLSGKVVTDVVNDQLGKGIGDY